MQESFDIETSKNLSIKHGEQLLSRADQPATLPECLHKTSVEHGQRKGIIYVQSDGSELYQSYAHLWEDAQRLMTGLRYSGLGPQDTVILQLAENEQFVPALWGCLLTGVVPTPLAVPSTYIQSNNATQKLQDAWKLLNYPVVVTNREMLPELLDWAQGLELNHFRAFAIEDLFEHESAAVWHYAQPDDLALLLLTSGSTGAPKAVMLRHCQVLSMITGMIQMYSFSEQDVTFNWMPFDHVGGIVMMHLRDIYLGCQEINVANQTILLDPLSWLDGIDHYRATVTWAPNFAFGLVNDYADEIKSRHWDLSSLHYLLNGGEAIVAKVGRKCLALLEPHGLPADAIRPAWGMSETSSGVIFSERFLREIVHDDDAFVEVGIPIPGLSIRIVNDDNQLVVEDTIGRLQVKGLSVTSGYYRQPELNQSVFTEDGWFETGDLGFLHEGRLTLTGRTKDTIIINGVNYYSHAIESAVEELAEVETSYTAACAVREDHGTTDSLAIFFVASVSIDNNQLAQLLRKIRYHVAQTVGITPEYVLAVEKEIIPKTAIGKIQRAQLKQSFEKGEFAGLLKQLDSISRGTQKRPPEKQVSDITVSKEEIQDYLGRFFVEDLNIVSGWITPDTNIHSLGINSILMMKLMRTFEKNYHIKITARDLFKYPTIQALATYLVGKNANSHSSVSQENIAKSDKPIASTMSSREASLQQAFLSPLSEVQKGLWTLQKMSPEMSAYHIPLCLRFSSALGIEKLKQAFRLVLEQHPILTSMIEEVNGIPYRKSHATQPLVFSLEDISSFAAADVLPYLRKKIKEPFIFKQGALMRIHILSRSEEEHFLLVVIHHIIFDGSSYVTFIQSLLERYKQLICGERPHVVSPTTTYDDFVAWEKEMLAGEDEKRYHAYWQQQLAGTLPDLQLPADHPDHDNTVFEGKTYTRPLSTALIERIKMFAHDQSINASTVLLGCYMLLLKRYSGQEDIIVGMPVMVRPEERFDALIGYFLNMLPIRSQLPAEISFLEFANRLQLTLLDGLDHAPYPFPRIVRALDRVHAQAVPPLFRAAFFYQNFLQKTSYAKIFSQYARLFSVDLVEGIHQEGEYPLVFELLDEEDRMGLNIKYNADLFDGSTIESMFERYIYLLETIIENPTRGLDEYSVLNENEQNTLLYTWNATQADYPDVCFHELFEQQVHRNPYSVAVWSAQDSLSYYELHEKSRLLALYLQAQGAGPDSLIGICMERSLNMIVGLLAIVLAGAAYVPLDPDYPEERLSYMLENSKAAIILTQYAQKNKFDRLNRQQAKVVALDHDWEEIIQVASECGDLKREVKPEHLAYVLYTSGSTGKPKGVMITHKALTNFLVSMTQKPGLDVADKLLAVTTYSFDIAGLELFLPLIVGAQCYICGAETTRNAEKLKREIQHVRPTIMQATPVTWTMLFQSGWENAERVKILCGGEALPQRLKQEFIHTGSDVWNMFGPTETTIWSTLQHITEDELITIGTPIANTQVYVVDQQLKLVPIGIPGELCIAGDGLARGYYQQPDLTAEKFVENPFHRGTRLYKTGDSVRWLPNGQIEYLGRIDSQVKIRGFRIELGAIESRIDEHPGVQEAVTVVHLHQERKQLVAYYIAHDLQRAPSAQELRRYVSAALPDYMVPSHYIRLDALPLTPNGKVDRKNLEQRVLRLERPGARRQSSSRIEETLREIWQDVLQVDNLGIDAGFFDVGGDSLLAIAVTEHITETLGSPFRVTELFEYPTIRAISEFLASAQEGVSIAPAPLVEQENKGEETHKQESLDESIDLPDYYRESVAIIGISCQFPGGGNYREFWEHLRAGEESFVFLTKEELRNAGIAEDLIEDPDYVPVHSSIEGKELFDPGFFHLSHKDAEMMDPQMRLLLLHSWKAVEDAGYVSSQIPHTSVYMSASTNGYRSLLSDDVAHHINNPDGYVSWVLSQSGTIPTMISHKLGFTGPSYFVHANCSSSLIGMASAYQSLQAGDARYALVGGATVHARPNLGYLHQTGLNFSRDGHVKTFDADADGMTGGEGVAVIVLKRAVDAVQDSDHIYALLRGIGVNNDGAQKVGFYAPSVKGQAEVIRSVLEATGIDPETIGYVEAHGTGTKLGDPIELSALTSVYQQQSSKKQFCGIGSVKSNIGHLDTVAGLAGCIKVALSLHHNELVPSLNYTEPNPALDLENSPFYVVEQRSAWEKRSGVQRAALSAFGLGGTNTHAIFEQYVEGRTLNVREQEAGHNGVFLIPLSARKQERLQAYAQELLTFVRSDDVPEGSLRDLAYTLQVGREAMEERAVFLARDVDELARQLEKFVRGEDWIEGCVRGGGTRGKDIEWLEDDEERAALIEGWLSKGKLRQLAQVWSKGIVVAWEKLYQQSRPQRMSLPTYPFAPERYWPEQKEKRSLSGVSTLHPLLHQNTSDLSEQRFSSTFTGQEFFLFDHVVRGKRILPGVAYLEMIRAAVKQAIGLSDDANSIVQLNHVVWIQPIVIDKEPVQIHIGLFPEENGKIAYEIYSHADNDSDPVVHCQGNAELCSAIEVPAWNLFDLQAQCRQSLLSPVQFYAEANNSGIAFGPAFRGIVETYAGRNEVLTKLSLPLSVSATQDEYILHPSMMDAAVQTATICIMMGLAQNKLLLPFALEELQVFGTCTSAMWAYARSAHGNKAGDAVQKVDVDLCDDTGVVCVRIKGFSTRILAGDVQSTDKYERLLLEPVWQEKAVVWEEPAPDYAEHVVFLCGFATDVCEHLTSLMDGVRVVTLNAGKGTPAERFQSSTEQVFDIIQKILHDRPQGNTLIQVVASIHGEQQVFAGLMGLLKTAPLEHSRLIGQLIEIEHDQDVTGIQKVIHDNRVCPHERHLRYQNGLRYVADWSEVTPSLSDENHRPWKEHGVYLITGGAGALGQLFAREIVRYASDAVVILAGRSRLDANKLRQIESLGVKGTRVVYRPVDVTENAAVDQMIQDIQKEYGHLDGIIHGAGVINDKLIVKKTREELHEVMAPKVAGLEYLDAATKDVKLDFFILFSSIAGSLGNAGQADYATANAFMDAFAEYRTTLVARKQRYGKTLSINWPLWKDGGMHVDPEAEKTWMQNLGMIPLRKETGIKTFYQALALDKSQIFVLEGRLEKMKQKLLSTPMPKPRQQHTPDVQMTDASIETGQLSRQVMASLMQMVSKILKVGIQDIDENTELGEYGFDSISFTMFANQINQECQLDLAPTLFFEYGTLKDLVAFLIEDHRAQLVKKFAISSPPSIVAPMATAEGKIIEAPIIRRTRKRFAHVTTISEEKSKVHDFEPIAIVGMSGKFPGARNIDEFWENLVDGKDCITEIPDDRWDWQEYYGDPLKDANKTNIKWGGFIDGVSEFDPLFFGISPREAHFIDPQQRLLMTYAWMAIEDAGYSAQELSGTKMGVFVGTGNTGYKDLFHAAHVPIEGHAATGNMIPSVGPNRISYFLNLHGPSEPIETACSSSLVAIHRAVSAMESGGCTMALVGGVNTIVTPEAHISYSKAGMLSSDGRCKTFSDHADGYARGEGVGMIMLKKLKDAEHDMDHIYAVIRGTAENHGGRANTLTSPNPKAQTDLLVAAYKQANIDPRTVTYIEAHGTGTELGDPIEINGLKAAFKELYQATEDFDTSDHRCGLGSVKSNIGHLELAAGISGVLKVLLQMKHRTLVKSLHTETLNPYIQLKDSPFYIVQENSPWKTVRDSDGQALPLRAGVSSFGIGGVNAHIVIEEYLPRDVEPSRLATMSQHPAIVVLSAKNDKRLLEQAEQLLVAMRAGKYSASDLGRVAYTLQVGREAMEERLALLVGSIVELEEKLQAFVEGIEHIEGLYHGHTQRNKDLLSVFMADEDMGKIVDTWISKRKYVKLVELWVKGLNIDWNKLYAEVRPRRISLPTYPFAKDHYWLPASSLSNQGGAVNRVTHFLTKQWEPVSVLRSSSGSGTVAILTRPETAALATELARNFSHPQILDVHQLIVPTTSFDWTHYAGVVDLVGCGHDSDETMEWITWLQALLEYGRKDGLRLLGVTRGLEPFQNTSINLAGASRVGLYRMLQSEYRHLSSCHLDGDVECDDATLARQIADEFYAESDDLEVCYRMGQRYRALLGDCPTTEIDLSRPLKRFPEDQALIITGGTRGLGALCARHFVQQYGVKRLVLIGREALPPRSQWEQEAQLTTALSEKVRLIQELEAQGAQVRVLSLRLSDEGMVREHLRAIKETMGPIAGVLHCAGITDVNSPAFLRKDKATIQAVLEPKVAGLATLLRLLQQEPLQFFVLFSSVSGIIPVLSAGQADYAMANASMDYVAQAYQALYPMLSIQWPNWKEAGMGEVTTSAYRETGLLSITNSEGLHLLDQLLAGKRPTVILPAMVEPASWSAARFLQRSRDEKRESSFSYAHPERESERKEMLEAVASNESTPGLREQTQAWLVDLFADELRVAPAQLEVDEPVQEYGVDSILLVQVLQRINQSLKVTLDPSILYEYPTIEGFAFWLVETYTLELTALFETSTAETPVARDQITPADQPSGDVARMLIHDRMSLQAHQFASSGQDDIAVVGLSCRFPGAETLNAYWELLSAGRSAISTVPFERWGIPTSYAAGVITNSTCFDSSFFQLPEEDTRAMDPQALVVLEECLKLWYHAGYRHEEVKGKAIGIYLGGRSQHIPGDDHLLQARNPIVAVGQNYLAANLSHFFDVRGPSVVLDTACSSALVGLSMAIQALRSREIEAAVVGGVSLLETDATHQLFQQRGILGKGTAFHIFDERANGVVLGEGVGMVLVKTVAQAMQDGDTIYAVIKAAAINNDGRTAGPATPNLQAQKEVMQAALTRSGKRAEEISHLEANGSGSMVTDLIELKAIQAVYQSSEAHPLSVGSIKPNIGHPLCAEGIASLIKVVLMLQHRCLVPFLSGEQALTHFDREAANLSFIRRQTEWAGRVPVAAINCFADGGTNAHVIVEGWEEAAERLVRRHPLLPPRLKKRSLLSGNRDVFTKNSEGSALSIDKANIWDTYELEV